MTRSEFLSNARFCTVLIHFLFCDTQGSIVAFGVAFAVIAETGESKANAVALVSAFATINISFIPDPDGVARTSTLILHSKLQ